MNQKTRPPGNQWRAEYVSRINRVIDHIEANLGKRLTLEGLAKVANFSPYHFHRVFGAMVGETLNHFIARLRTEKAAMQLAANPKKSITEIALDCGFSSSATFARAFKERFSMTATEWREARSPADSKIGKQARNGGKKVSKIGEAPSVFVSYVGDSNRHQLWRGEMDEKMSVDVEVMALPELNVAYIRHIGPYAGQTEVFEGLFNRLFQWAGPRGLLGDPESKILSVYHDDPEVTEEDKLRVDACLTVAEGTQVDGEVGQMKVPGGQFAVAHFELNPDQYTEAWTALMGGWLPQSGYQPDDRLCYELYRNDPKQHPEGKCVVDICVPVRPL
jgi:AraC family transcriptional regulator